MKIVKKYKNSVVGIVMDKEYCYKNKDFIQNYNDLYTVALHLLMERCCMQISTEAGKGYINSCNDISRLKPSIIKHKGRLMELELNYINNTKKGMMGLVAQSNTPDATPFIFCL